MAGNTQGLAQSRSVLMPTHVTILRFIGFVLVPVPVATLTVRPLQVGGQYSSAPDAETVFWLIGGLNVLLVSAGRLRPVLSAAPELTTATDNDLKATPVTAWTLWR